MEQTICSVPDEFHFIYTLVVTLQILWNITLGWIFFSRFKYIPKKYAYITIFLV